jgi:hypothetical protein
VVVHSASDYVSTEQLEKEFVSSFILGDVMNCVYIVKVEAIHGPLFVFKNYVFWSNCKQMEKMQINYSVPCQEGDVGNTLAKR